MDPGSGKHQFLGGVIIAVLVVVGLMFDSVGTDLSGRASGHRASSGCGGGSVGNTPAICRVDDECGEGEACVENACREETEVEEPSYEKDCLPGQEARVVSNPASDSGAELSYRWEEDEGTMTSGERETTENLLNGVYGIFQSEFNYEVIEEPLTFRVFSDPMRWARCMEALDKPAGAGPFFTRKRDRVFFLRTDEAWDFTLRILIHEGTHFIFSREIFSGGIHFNEGAAVFASTIEASSDDEGAYTVSPHNARYERLLTTMREEGSLMGLGEFLSLSHQEWQESNPLGYTQSYSLVFFLMENDRPLARTMMENLKRAPRVRQTHREVIEANYAPGTAEPFVQFEEDWNTWLEEEHRSLTFGR